MINSRTDHVKLTITGDIYMRRIVEKQAVCVCVCVCGGGGGWGWGWGEGLISGDIKKGSDMSVRAYLQGDLITRNVTVNAPNFDSRFTLVTKIEGRRSLYRV